MKKLNELKDLQEFVIDPATGKKVYRPSSEIIEEWGQKVDKLWERFLQLQREGKIPK